MNSTKDFNKTRAELKKLSQAVDGVVLQGNSMFKAQPAGSKKQAKKSVAKDDKSTSKHDKKPKTSPKRSSSADGKKKKSPSRTSSATRKQLELADNLIALAV